MIAMTPRRDRRRSSAARSPTATGRGGRHRAGVRRQPGRGARRAVRRRARASTSTGTTSPPRPSQAGAAAVLGARPTGVPTVRGRRPGAAPSAGWPATCVGRRSDADRASRSPAPRARPATKDMLAAGARRRRRPTVATAGNRQQRARRPTDRAARRRPRPATSSLEMGARGIGHIADLCAIAPPDVSRPCSTSAPPTSASSAPARRSRTPRASSSRRSPADGIAVLNADDALVAAMARRTRARVLTFGRRRGDVRLPRAASSTSSAGPPSSSGTTAPGRRVRLLEAGAHQVANAAAAAATGARGRASRWPTSSTALALGRAPCRRGGWSCTSAPTAWSSSTTPTTPTPTRWTPPLDALAAIGRARATPYRRGPRRDARARATPRPSSTPRSACTPPSAGHRRPRDGRRRRRGDRRRRASYAGLGGHRRTVGGPCAGDGLAAPQCRGPGRRPGQGVARRRPRAPGRRAGSAGRRAGSNVSVDRAEEQEGGTASR